ncbi:MAG TPA: hypothetical protein PKA88_11595 [Polyangiaceae bacterium]|nr:hypothetical protein [Polyangiaceae bacterium]
MLGEMDLDAPFDFGPQRGDAPPSAHSRARMVRQFAAQVLDVSRSAVVVVLDLSTREAMPIVAGPAPVPDSDEEALMSLWLQHGDSTALRSVPPRLREILPADKALVMPLLTPGGAVGVLAMSPPCVHRRVLRKIEALASDFAVTLEASEREPASRDWERRTARSHWTSAA